MHKIKEATADDSITVGNGSNKKAQQVASITGMRCDKHSNKLGMSELTDVTHLLTGKFNLFSLSKMQMNGWALHGDATTIWMTKDETKSFLI
jgi:hypothetical protein